MLKQTFCDKVRPYLETNWENIVHEAEEQYARSPLGETGSYEHIAKIKEASRSILVSRLEMLKGNRMSVYEMKYTIDLFNAHCKAIEYFGILDHVSSVGVISETSPTEAVCKKNPLSSRHVIQSPSFS
jgi:hypothetical protein